MATRAGRPPSVRRAWSATVIHAVSRAITIAVGGHCTKVLGVYDILNIASSATKTGLHLLNVRQLREPAFGASSESDFNVYCYSVFGSSRADVARAARVPEAAHRLGQQELRQIQHDLRK